MKNEISLYRTFKIIRKIEKSSPYWEKTSKGYKNSLKDKIQCKLSVEVDLSRGQGYNDDYCSLSLFFHGRLMTFYKEANFDGKRRIKNLFKSIDLKYNRQVKENNERELKEGIRFINSIIT